MWYWCTKCGDCVGDIHWIRDGDGTRRKICNKCAIKMEQEVKDNE
jgi:protein-arginine kinase activator protein McsA